MCYVCYSDYMAHTSVRDVDPELWRQLRAAALVDGKNVGELLNEIIREWLARR